MNGRKKMETTVDQWRTHVDAYQKSDLSGAAFCRTRGISYYSFRYWLKKLDLPKPRTKLPTAKADAFIPVKINNNIPINLSINGVEIRLAKGFNPDLLKELVCVLRSC